MGKRMTDTASLPRLETFTDAFFKDPNAMLGRKGERIAISAGEHGVEVFSYELVKKLFLDRRLEPPGAHYFEEGGATPLLLEFVEDGLLLNMAPARHDHVRRIMLKGFTPRRIEASRAMIAGLADRFASEIAGRGRCDLVRDFTHHLSVGVISGFIGISPEDVGTFEKWPGEFRLLKQIPLAPYVPRVEAALNSLREYVVGLIEERRKQPREDLIGDLVAAGDADGKLSPNEVIWGIGNLIYAGHDTTRFQIALCVRALIAAGVWERLAAEPALIHKAMVESMRLHPVTARLPRIALEDIEIAGHALRKGQMVLLHVAAAGRDAEAFDEPDRFMLDRAGPEFDIGFGLGVHYCLGHALARTEIVEALGKLTARLTEVAIDGEIRMTPPTASMRAMENLPLRFRARAN